MKTINGCEVVVWDCECGIMVNKPVPKDNIKNCNEVVDRCAVCGSRESVQSFGILWECGCGRQNFVYKSRLVAGETVEYCGYCDEESKIKLEAHKETASNVALVETNVSITGTIREGVPSVSINKKHRTLSIPTFGEASPEQALLFAAVNSGDGYQA